MILSCTAAALITFQIACGQPDSEQNDQSESIEAMAEDGANNSDSQANEEEIEVEQPFKPIHASFVDGKNNVVDLSSLRGKVIFINMWATWCPPCIKEMPSLNRLYQKYKDSDKIEFLFVEMDNDYEKAEKFLIKNKYNIPLYSINDNLPVELETSSIPTTVIIDSKGELNIKHIGSADFDHPEIQEHIASLLK